MNLLLGIGFILSVGGWGLVVLPFLSGFDSRYAGNCFLAAFVVLAIGNLMVEFS